MYPRRTFQNNTTKSQQLCLKTFKETLSKQGTASFTLDEVIWSWKLWLLARYQSNKDQKKKKKQNKNASESVDLHLATESSSWSNPNHYQSSPLATFGASHEKLAVQRWGVGGKKFSDLFCACWVIPAGMEVSTLLYATAQNPLSLALWLIFPRTQQWLMLRQVPVLGCCFLWVLAVFVW